MDLPPPSLATALQDRYHLERELGHGGMAIVYLAHELRHDRQVALKVLRPELCDLLGRERFLREIGIAARLHHPNILPLFDSGASRGFLYYAMPFVEGESLRDRLDREKQLSLEETLTITRDVAAALAHAHAQGVVHRDIKPGNILLSGGHALVADFGIARAVTAAGTRELTTRGIAIGTPSYMSPEQIDGKDGLDGRSDLYSLACVVYEMLAGEPPFTGRTAQAIAARQLQEPPRSLRIVRPTLPRAVQEVVEVGLAKVRADRYPSVDRFVEALERASRQPRVGRGLRTGLMAAAAAGTAVVAAGWLLLDTPAPLDPHKIVVLPLVEIPAASPSGIGEAIAVMIESALEHTEPLRWIDGWQQLTAAQRADPALVTSEVIRKLARDRGARWYTTGTVVHRNDSITVLLRLNDALGDSIVGQASASVPQAQGPQAGLHAVSELLIPIIAPGQSIDLTALGERRPRAVADWLQGEREYRRGNFDSALVHLRRAVAEDSALAFASVRGAQAASWKNLLPEADSFARVAMTHIALLPRRQADFTRGFASYLAGQADTAVFWLRAALEHTPDWPEAHTALAEVYHHLLPEAAPLDSLAVIAFRAAAADTAFAPPYFHLAEIAIRRGELARAESAAARFARLGGGDAEREELRVMLGCARRGSGGVDWSGEARRSPLVILSVARMLSVGGSFPDCAAAAARALLVPGKSEGYHFAAFLLLHYLLVATGQREDAVALVDSMAAAKGWPAITAVSVVSALADQSFDPRVEASLELMRRNYGAGYEDSLSSSHRLLLGAWYAGHGRMAAATRLQQGLRHMASATGEAEAALYADALEAHILLARGDSLAALQAAERLRPISWRDLLTWGHTEALPAERLLRARLLFARGRYEQAISVADAFDHPTPIVYLAFLPASLELRYAAARALSQPGRASRYRARLAALRSADDLASRNEVLHQQGGRE